jgi:hypothetical protein
MWLSLGDGTTQRYLAHSRFVLALAAVGLDDGAARFSSPKKEDSYCVAAASAGAVGK